MSKPECLFYAADSHTLRVQAERITAEGGLDTSRVAVSPEDLYEQVGDARPEVLVADLGDDPEATLAVLDKLPSPRPGLIVIGPGDQSGSILRAMRMGVREYFDAHPTDAELLHAIERIRSELAGAPGAVSSQPARIIAVMGAKGGVGATVVACQLATSLQRLGGRTVVVDLNLPLGDVSLHFDVQPSYTLANIARESAKLDATFLRTLLQRDPSTTQILAAPTHVEEAELVTAGHVQRVLELLRVEFDWVILDVSRSWGEATVRALDLADRILLVTLMDVPTLHHTRQHIDLLARLGHAGNRIRLIANRYSSADPVPDRDVTTFLERTPDFRVPNDYRTTLAAVNRGVSVAEVAPRGALARSFSDLAVTLHEWCGVELPAAGRSGGVLTRAARAIWRR